MRITWPFSSRCAWMAGSQARNWVVVRSPTRFGSIDSAASMKAIEPSGGPGRSKKKMSLGVLAFFFAFDLEPPRRRKFHAALPEGLFRVVHVVLGRRNREHLRARLHPRGRADGRSERGAHAFRDAVRPGPGRDLVLAENVVRIEAELEVVRVPGLLRDVPVRRNPRGLEGDVPDLARLRGNEMDLHRELRSRIANVELADSDLRNAAHVLFAGIGLSADLAIHASGFASHGPRGARRSERYLILGGSGRFRCGRKRDSGGLAPSRPSSENHQEAQDGHGRSADQGG